MVVDWRVLRTGLLVAVMLTPSALLAVTLLRASNVEPATAAAVTLNGVVTAASVAMTIGFAALCFFLLVSLFLRSPWAQSRRGYVQGTGLSAQWARSLIWVTAGAGIVVSLSVGLPGWFSLSQGLLVGKKLWWTLVATAGFVGALVLIRPLLVRRAGRLSGSKAIAAAFLAPAFLLSVLETWHTIGYVPAQLEATIIVEPSLRFGGSQAGLLDRGTAEYSLRNEGDTGTRVIISNFLICPRRDLSPDDVAVISDPACIIGTSPIGDRAVVEAKGVLTHLQIFTWSEGSTVVQARTRLAYARADKLILGERVHKSIPCPEGTGAGSKKKIEETYAIIPSSRYQAVVEPQYLLAYGPGDQGGRRYWVTTAEDLSCEWDPGLLQRFGIREMSVSLQEWITDREGSGSGS